MKINAKHPIAIGELNPEWSRGLVEHSTSYTEIRFPHRGAESEIIEHVDLNRTEAILPERILDIIQFCENDFRETHAAQNSQPTLHCIEIRTGRQNQISLINNYLNYPEELFGNLEPHEDFVRLARTYSSGRTLVHRDYNEEGSESLTSYFCGNIYGTLSWQQKFYIPDTLNGKRFMEAVFLTFQAVTNPKSMPDNTLMRALPETFVHAKPAIPRRFEGYRSWLRNTIDFEYTR